nr:uncharacterized protein LOC123774158 [Procambarus clarkii]
MSTPLNRNLLRDYRRTPASVPSAKPSYPYNTQTCSHNHGMTLQWWDTISGLSGIPLPTTISDLSGIPLPTTISGLSGITLPTNISGLSGITLPTTISGLSGITLPTNISGLSGITLPTNISGLSGITLPTTISGLSGIPLPTNISGLSGIPLPTIISGIHTPISISASSHIPPPTVLGDIPPTTTFHAGKGKAVLSAPSAVPGVVEAVFSATLEPSSSVIFLTDGTTVASTLYTITDRLHVPGGVGVFEVAVNTSNFNQTESHLSRIIPDVKKLRQLSSHTTVSVISDDLAFLSAFFKWSLKSRLLVWSTRLLVVTRLTLHHLQSHYAALSKMNAMLLVISDDIATIRCKVYVHLPFRHEGTEPLLVASWRPRRGILLTSRLPLFPHKFSRQEVAIASGPFILSEDRAEVVDFTVAIMLDYWRILAARGRPEVDPWSFLLPLTPQVWAAILGALLVLPLAVLLLSSCLSLSTHGHEDWLLVPFDYVRMLVQQDIMGGGDWWWERVVLTVWGLVTVVLTQSYAGNLMALLAVRHISEPYQSRRQVLDDPSATIIWLKGSATGTYLEEAESGIYREMAEAARVGRLIYKTHAQVPASINTLVRHHRHVLIDAANALRSHISDEFTKKGECSFYSSNEEFLPLIFGMIGPKDSPLIPALNKRIIGMTEAGLFFQWMKSSEKNSTACSHAPTKITVKTPLSLTNIWGVFVILGAGHGVGLQVLCIELLSAAVHRSCWSPGTVY